MSEYDNLCEPDEEEIEAAMREIADQDRAYEEMLEAHAEFERECEAEYDNWVFDPEVDWNSGEIAAMSAP